MLQVITRGDLLEPGPGAPLEIRAAWRRSGEIPFLWRLKYDLPPNDPRFLDLDEEVMAMDLLEHMYHQVRTRRDDPMDREMNEVVASTRSAQDALREFATNTERYDAGVRAFQARLAQPERTEIVRVVTRTPGKTSE